MYGEEEQNSSHEDSLHEDHEVFEIENFNEKKQEIKSNVRNLRELKVSKLMDFKELVEEVYGEEVIRNFTAEELKGLFSKRITPKVCAVEGQTYLTAGEEKNKNQDISAKEKTTFKVS